MKPLKTLTSGNNWVDAPVMSKRGRPSAAEAIGRQNTLIDQALKHFIAYGYKSTTMDHLAASLGASKSTIYRRYGSKVHLLRAAMERSVPIITDLLAQVDADPKRDVEAVLRDFAAAVQDFHADPSLRAMWRAVSQAGDELIPFSHDSTTQENEALAPIANYLASMETAGRLVVGEASAMAACFTELASGGLTGFLGSPPTKAQRRKTIDLAIALFLKGVLPR